MRWKKKFLILLLMIGLSAIFGGASARSATPRFSTAPGSSQPVHHESLALRGFEARKLSCPNGFREYVKDRKQRQPNGTQKRHKRTRESKAFIAKRTGLPALLYFCSVTRRVLSVCAPPSPDVISNALRGPPVSA